MRGCGATTAEGGHPTYGFAPFIRTFRSNETNLAGQPYLNSSGQPYLGSICDHCEQKGFSCFHHPLRCFDCHPQWKEKGGAPELNGVRTWFVRGGKKATMKDDGSVAISD